MGIQCHFICNSNEGEGKREGQKAGRSRPDGTQFPLQAVGYTANISEIFIFEVAVGISFAVFFCNIYIGVKATELFQEICACNKVYSCDKWHRNSDQQLHCKMSQSRALD